MKNLIVILLLFYACSAKEKIDTATFAGGCFWWVTNMHSDYLTTSKSVSVVE